MTVLPLTLCMTVRNEAARLGRCLDAVRPWVSEILIADTGSSDDTVRLLEQRYQLRVQHIPLQESRCFALADARNMLIAQARHEWVLSLDADETLIMRAPDRLRTLLGRPDVAGYFGAWINDCRTATEFADYKLFLFRRSIRMSGLIHSNATIDLRRKGLMAEWQECFHVLHDSNPAERLARQQVRRRRLQCALRLEPDWIRYHWFLGYSFYLSGELEAAKRHLKIALERDSDLFPVEQLNAGVMLACCWDQLRDQVQLRAVLQRLGQLRSRFSDDIELCANQATLLWIEAAADALASSVLELPPPPQFAC